MHFYSDEFHITESKYQHEGMKHFVHCLLQNRVQWTVISQIKYDAITTLEKGIQLLPRIRGIHKSTNFLVKTFFSNF